MTSIENGYWDAGNLGIPPVSTTLFIDGDTTFTWNKDNEAEVISLIQKKMDEGHIFLIIEPSNFFTRIFRKTEKQVLVRETEQLSMRTPVIHKANVSDPQINELIDQGKIALVGQINKSSTVSNTHRAKTASEAAQHHTIAIPRLVGG